MNRLAEEQAIEWHDRLEQDVSAETMAAYQAWRAADPANARAFDQQFTLVDQIEALGWRPSPAAGTRPPARQRRAPLIAGIGALAAAAAVAAVVTLGGVGQHRSGLPAIADWTAPTALRAVRLDQGTLTLVSADASVTNRAGRRVLTGDRARFIVGGDQPTPFVIYANGLRIAALPGAFEVMVSDGQTRVTALDAPLVVATADQPAGVRPASYRVPPGSALVHVGSDWQPVRHSPPVPITTLDVEGLSLGDLAAVVATTPGPRLLLGRGVDARHVTGRFAVADHAALARKLAAALDLRVSSHGSDLRLNPR